MINRSEINATNWKEAMIRTNKEWREELDMVHKTTVEGHTYKYWSDTYFRGTFAENARGEIHQIKHNGYITNDLTVRKAIATVFGHGTFKK